VPSLLTSELPLCRTAGSFVDHAYIGLLGVIPLLLGLRKLYDLIKESRASRLRSQDAAVPTPLPSVAADIVSTPPPAMDEDSVLMRQPVTFHYAEEEMHSEAADQKEIASQETVLSFTEERLPSPASTGVEPAGPVPSVATPSTMETNLLLCLTLLINRNALKVAAVTVANGADNLGKCHVIHLYCTGCCLPMCRSLRVLFCYEQVSISHCLHRAPLKSWLSL
jgi:hypothetical protein